jgi:CheY-like chemotaxis protein/anti-sigma regulatory factor (Ser/Thr protein kinase)
MKVLIVEDDPSVNYFLREVASNTGHEVLCAENGEEALACFDEFQPDLVLSDLKMPKVDGLKLLERIRRRSRDVLFIIMTGAGSEEYAVRALELRANNYLQKPIRFEVIVALLQKYEQMLRVTHLREEVGRMVVRRDLRMVIPSRLEFVGSVVEELVREASAWLSIEERFGVQLGLYELITNAIEHGNLCISYEEKNKALFDGPFHFQELVARRLADPRLAGREVQIDFRQTESRLEWQIVDEGDGFNWMDIPNPLDGLNQERLNGRGIFLARFQFDELNYFGNGNKVRAVKRFDEADEDKNLQTG